MERAVHHCPQAEVLWLMWAKEKWVAGDVPASREVLEKAFIANPESEQIWLAAVKLEAENGELGVARELLVRARTVADTQRVGPRFIYESTLCSLTNTCLPSILLLLFNQIWMKSAVFERQQGQTSTALETLSIALKKYPKFAKLYMIQGQIYQSQQNYPAARASFATGIKTCPKDVTLWILASRLEEADGKSIKARALLDKARLANPASDALWAEAVGVEERSGGAAQAKTVLARGTYASLCNGTSNIRIPNVRFPALFRNIGLQECPTSGVLWSMAVWAEPRPGRKSRSTDALKKSNNDPLVICTVARLFWAERKIEKARQWFERAVAGNSDLGDIWAWWLKFERQHGILVSLRSLLLFVTSLLLERKRRIWLLADIFFFCRFGMV